MPARRVVPARATVLWLAVAAAASALPAPVHGATSIPPDQTGQMLGGTPITAIVGDIDGDDVRELITLGPRDEDPVHLAVAVFEERAGGEVVSAGSAPLARVASVTEQLSGLPRPDENNLLQARVDEPARLIAWRERGRERVLAVAIGTLRNARACCLSIWAVERGEGGIRLRLLTDTMRSADQVRAVDMDADGTDELVVTEPREDSRPNAVTVAVLRWTGQRFSGESMVVSPAAPTELLPLGDSDGQSGDEVGLIGEAVGSAQLYRIALNTDGGELRGDAAELPFAGRLIPLSEPGGGRLVLGNDTRGTVLLRWPAGRRMSVAVASPWDGVPMTTIGTGTAAMLVKVRGERVLDIFSAGLRSLNSGITGTLAEVRFHRAGIPTYAGQLPGGMAGGEAFIFHGRMVSAASQRRGGPVVSDTSVMPGGVPIGLFGSRSELLAMAQATAPAHALGFDASREGGQLSQPAGGLRSTAIVVADAELSLSPEADHGLIQPAPQGPVRVEPGPNEPFVLAGGAFTLPITGPPRTRILLRVGDAEHEAQVAEDGTADVRVSTEGYEDGDRVRVTLLAITPAGQGYGGGWMVSIHTRPPSLSASTPFAPLGFDVSVSGRTTSGATVAVDGTPVPVTADGRFEVAVAAGLWPRDVQIEATDPLGNRNSTTVSVVAPLDYRQLPWIPIVALLTILAGIVLYLRVPHPRPAAASGQITDATLEDLD
jgi:hypothetical protein